MNKVYIVMGNTGEYADRCDWSVVAFDSEAKAKKHVKFLNKKAEELSLSSFYASWDSTDDEGRDREEREVLMEEFDPHVCVDYTGVHYSYFQVDMA